MLLLWIILGYTAASAALFVALWARCKKNPVFREPAHEATFYILSCTWGMPLTLFGAIVALVMRLKGHKPTRFGYGWSIEIPGIDWGLEMGLFFISPVEYKSVRIHEYGHGIQNVYLGPFMLPVVTLPSVIRFWYRKLRKAIGRPCKTGYNDIWFENSATETGVEAVANYLGHDPIL